MLQTGIPSVNFAAFKNPGEQPLGSLSESKVSDPGDLREVLMLFWRSYFLTPRYWKKTAPSVPRGETGDNLWGTSNFDVLASLCNLGDRPKKTLLVHRKGIALQAISQVPAGSDTSAYAQAFSSALFNAGVLNASNIDTLGSRVLSAVLNGVSSAAQGVGISVDSGSVQSDISSSSSFLSTSSSASSFSQTSASSTSGAGYTGPAGPSGYPGPVGGGAPFGQTSGLTAPTGGQGAFGGATSGASAGLISRVANALANTSTLRTVLRRGVSQQIASSVVQRAAQSLSSTLGVDGNNFSRIALQAISQVPAGSDTSAYAQAFSSALFNAGVLNASNIDTLGSRVLSAVLNGVSSAAQGVGISVDSGSVQSDISSSSSFLSTSSSASSFSQTSASSTSGAGYTGPAGPSGYAGPVDGGAQFGSVSGQSSFGQTSLTASAGAQGGFLGGVPSGLTSGAGQSAGVSLISSLNSPVGLRSGSAASRISQLTSSVTNAVGPNGVDVNALARSLQSSFSALRSSGMSSSDAKIEVLLETIVGLLQLLSNTQIRGVNPATASSVANSAARSFELVLA
ncbi:hypothetical protein HNY73_007006 [Argiope bruennichi]|uniref:Spidroin C-terminal domain-containing protein n=1 Tax=Argiope bruennichi TaxID=94029 RepID=A0A8T0FCM4_ARGBR|nr:hypothetical protein HNY73_007006 [Argiope bruennichi]